MKCLKHEELTFTVCHSCDELEGTWKLPGFYYKQALKTDPSLCSSMNEYNTHLDEFAFIASSQLLNVAHELILWNWSLLFAWPQHGQGCSRQRKREGAFTKMKRYWDMSKGHAVVKKSYYRATRPQSINSLRVCIYTSFHVHLKPHFSFSEIFLLFCQNDKLPFSHHCLFYSDFLFR